MVETETKIQRYESYKDSGVEWLGEIPQHWEIFPLFALTELKSITNCVDEELLSVYLDKGVIRFSDVTAKRTNVTSLDLSKYQLVEQGDFVLNNQQAWRGSVGVSSYRGIVSPAYIVLKLSKSLNPSFANYLFRDGSMVSQYLINSKGVGTIQRNLYWPSLRRSSISLPPLPEQTAIAQFLDDKTTKIDAAIAIKQQQIALLKERKQILIHKAVTSGLNDNVTLKNSGVEWLGDIPEHWEVFPLFALTSLKSITNCVDEELLSVYLEKGVIRFSDVDSKRTNVTSLDLSKYQLVEPGDFVLNNQQAWRGSVGVSKYTGIVSPAYIVLKLSDKINPIYANYLFRDGSMVSQYLINSKGVGTIQRNLYWPSLRRSSISLPPLPEQTAIAQFLDDKTTKIETAISLKEQEISKLQEYKSSLINSVVTGKVRVC